MQGMLGRLVKYGIKKKWGIEIPERGKDLHDIVTISPELAVRGGKFTYLNRSEQRELLVTIPPGIRAGQRIRLKRLGSEGKGGGEPGDLFLRVRVRSAFFQKLRDVFDQLLAYLPIKTH